MQLIIVCLRYRINTNNEKILPHEKDIIFNRPLVPLHLSFIIM